MIRHDHWPRLLAEAIQDAAQQPFVWGTHDCALFSADMVKVMTGVDVAAKWRGRYKTPKGAARYTKGDPAIMADRAFEGHGVKTGIDPAYAQRGDVVAFVDGDGNKCLGIISSDASKVAAMIEEVSPPYVALIPRERAGIYRVWRV